MKRIACACAALGFASAIAIGQQVVAPAQSQVFRTATEAVQLDVSVLDKQGQPVHGLTQQDFAVFEDGKPQSVVAFKAIDLPETVTPSASSTAPIWTHTVAHDVSTNQLDNHRLFTIVMDDATIAADASVIERAKDAARSVIDKMGPNDLATVMFTRRDNTSVQDFTSDHARLIDTVETFSVGDRIALFADCLSQRNAVGVLTRVAGYLAAAPDQRKALVYVSSSLDVDFAKPDACGVSSVMQGVFRAAQQTNVNIYPIDACGLRTMFARPSPDVPCAETGANTHADFLRAIADNTGGHAVVMTNDFEPGIAQMFRTTGS
jgi:VWFA-related protein